MILTKYKEYVTKYNLKRFVNAHRNVYASALKEIQAGKKQSHWMWYIFPQLHGLGHSSNSNYYGIIDRDKAIMFLHHPVLGKKLWEITMAMLAIDEKSADEILGGINAFNAVFPDNIFAEALHKFYDGKKMSAHWRC